MALLYLTEFIGTGRYGGASIQSADTGNWVENANSPIVIGNTANQSAPFGTHTTLIRVHADAVCSVVVSSNGTPATIANARWAANQTEYFYVRPGQILSVISNV